MQEGMAGACVWHTAGKVSPEDHASHNTVHEFRSERCSQLQFSTNVQPQRRQTTAHRDGPYHLPQRDEI